MVIVFIFFNCDMVFGIFLYIKKKVFLLLCFDKKDKLFNLIYLNSSCNILRFISEFCTSSNNM